MNNPGFELADPGAMSATSVVPAAVQGTRVSLQGHEQIRDHAGDGFDGLLTVAGAKFTTARAVAEKVTDLVLAKLQHAPVACRTASSPL